MREQQEPLERGKKIMKTVIGIPARLGSSRFPGKPLADIKGKSMLQRVWEKCVGCTSPDNVIVATDDRRIKDHCNNHEEKHLRQIYDQRDGLTTQKIKFYSCFIYNQKNTLLKPITMLLQIYSNY